MVADASSAPPRAIDEIIERCRLVRKNRETIVREVDQAALPPPARTRSPYVLVPAQRIAVMLREQQDAVPRTGVRG